MKKQVLTILAFLIFLPSFAQFSTGTITLTTSPLMTVKIDTNTTTATLTLTGPSDKWFGVGFGGTSMGAVTDYFISSSAASFEYNGSGRNQPSPDASQSWTIDSDITLASTRTIVATRQLVSSGDFTFVNSSASISIIYAFGEDGVTSLSYHGGKSSRTLTRTSLGIEDFTLNSASVFPNPSNGDFRIEAKSPLTKLTVYSQVGTLIKVIDLNGNSNNEEVNLKELASGVYLIELQSDSDKAWKKIIIE